MDNQNPDMTANDDQSSGYKEAPDTNDLAKKWNKRIAHARKHWQKFHKRVKHNRDLVAGFNWDADPDSSEFYKHRANLIHGTITAILPQIYARNPEISVTPTQSAKQVKLFAKTLATMVNRELENADLKGRAKSCVRAALTTSFGVIKPTYQRDIKKDPIIQNRIDDTQDNIMSLEGLMADIADPEQIAEMDAKKLELEQLLASLNEKVEITAAEGIVLDRVLIDNLLIDPSVVDFFDYKSGDWMAQIIPMKKSEAESQYSMKLDKAKVYKNSHTMSDQSREDGRFASAEAGALDEDKEIAIIEIWDKKTQRIYTVAEGCDYWLREPYAPPKVGERWFAFFILPFQLVDGQFVAPSLVDLTEKLQEEHNEARNRFNKHRDLCLPGWVASADISEKTIRRYSDSEMGEITLIDTEGKPLNQSIVPRQHPPIDAVVYDTAPIRYDWEQVTGMQDAARSSVVNPKTATEASIMAQALSGRVSEFRDQVEDWIAEIANYVAQILVQELTPAQVERVVGANVVEMQQIGMMQMPIVVERTYDWPEMSREDVFDMVEITIRAGTTGAPDKLEAQENWGKILPVIQGLITQIIQVQAQGADAEPLVALLKESLTRFDDKLDPESFIPKPPQPMQMPGVMPQQMPGQMPTQPSMM